MKMSREQRLIISFLTMRRFIGILGIALPIVVVLGSFLQGDYEIQASISGYYYTNMHDFFVGLLCVVGIFLISYQGYEKIDNTVSNLSGISALGMALFPTALNSERVVHVGTFLIKDNISSIIHLSFGTIFFLALSYNSIFLFTKRQTLPISLQKRRRNILYRICGIVMFSSIVFITIYTLFLRETSISKYYPVLIFESIALLSFGISWLVKGNTFFKDQKSHVS